MPGPSENEEVCQTDVLGEYANGCSAVNDLSEDNQAQFKNKKKANVISFPVAAADEPPSFMENPELYEAWVWHKQYEEIEKSQAQSDSNNHQKTTLRPQRKRARKN